MFWVCVSGFDELWSAVSGFVGVLADDVAGAMFLVSLSELFLLTGACVSFAALSLLSLAPGFPVVLLAKDLLEVFGSPLIDTCDFVAVFSLVEPCCCVCSSACDLDT